MTKKRSRRIAQRPTNLDTGATSAEAARANLGAAPSSDERGLWALKGLARGWLRIVERDGAFVVEFVSPPNWRVFVPIAGAGLAAMLLAQSVGGHGAAAKL